MMDDRNINAFGDVIKKRRARGIGRKPPKRHISIRMDKEICDAMLRKYGEHWRRHINAALRDSLQMTFAE